MKKLSEKKKIIQQQANLIKEKEKDFAAKLAYRKFLNDLDLETIQMLERDKRAQENIEKKLTRTDRQNLGQLEHLGEHKNIPT